MAKKLEWRSSLPFVGMTSTVVAVAINTIISKMALSNGSSLYFLSVYSNGFATLILFPLAFLFDWSKRPPMSFAVLWRIFLLASFGCFVDLANNAGVNYSSPTLCTAMLNLVPAFTYILAIIFRMEQVNLRRLSSISKSIGTVVSIFGAFIVTFYKGPALLNTPSTNSGSLTQLYLSVARNWVLGGFLLACGSFFIASCCIFQASILKMYPAEMIVVAVYCLFVTIQSSLVTLIAERDLSTAWRIDTKIGLIAILYSGMMNIAFRAYVTAWCIGRRGPLFVSLFMPLTVVVAVIIGVAFMKDVLYLGSLVGAFVLIIGFYGVIWGKAKQGEEDKESESSDYRATLLQDKEEEEEEQV